MLPSKCNYIYKCPFSFIFAVVHLCCCCFALFHSLCLLVYCFYWVAFCVLYSFLFVLIVNIVVYFNFSHALTVIFFSIPSLFDSFFFCFVFIAKSNAIFCHPMCLSHKCRDRDHCRCHIEFFFSVLFLSLRFCFLFVLISVYRNVFCANDLPENCCTIVSLYIAAETKYLFNRYFISPFYTRCAQAHGVYFSGVFFFFLSWLLDRPSRIRFELDMERKLVLERSTSFFIVHMNNMKRRKRLK